MFGLAVSLLIVVLVTVVVGLAALAGGAVKIAKLLLAFGLLAFLLLVSTRRPPVT